jgi:uncharacterized protein YbaP (TraB family)
MITAFLAASIALTPVPMARPAMFADARPALWVVNDHDTIIYLFGTFHALDGRKAWFNDEVKTAFVQSNELVLETVIPPPEEPMPAPLPVAAGGAPSLLSTGKIVMKAGRSQGMSTDRGADMILKRAAEDAGKPVSGLEQFQDQLGLFSRLRGAAPAPREQDAARTSAALAALLEQLQAAWNRGDAESFAPMLDQMRLRSPDTYRMLFAERNRRWADWIAQRLDRPGTVFVAVGAGHLAGRDSVQSKLALANIRTARVN